jgi:homocitrate synthase NifV
MGPLTDRLLAWDGMAHCGSQALRDICRLLLDMGVSRLEMSRAVYERIRPHLQAGDGFPSLIPIVPGPPFVPGTWRSYTIGDPQDPDDTLHEICIRHGEDIPWDQLRKPDFLRLTVSDQWFFQGYPRLFSKLLPYADHLEFCPVDRHGLATALAAEWLLTGGTHVALSFLGKGGFASLEAVMMTLWLRERAGSPYNPALLTRLRAVFQAAAGQKIPARAPVVGERVFDVESGIHVDGIIKNPACYEPFPPETVGGARSIRMGKHSGRSNIRYALKLRGVPSPGQAMEAALLDEARAWSARLGRGLLDKEFDALLGRVMKGVHWEERSCV